MTTVTYPFDPTGVNPLNRINNEQHVLTSLNDTQLYQTVIPAAAPFFADNAVISFRNPDSSIRVLTEGVDYYFTNKFISASKATAKPVYGSITFLDKDITGVLRLGYQTVGGVWTLDDTEIATILANMVNNPRTTAWEQIAELPMSFPVIDHEWDLVDMVGATEMVEAIYGVRDAVLASSAGGIGAHVADKNNPHETNKAQVGLGDVQNYPIATQSQAEAGTNNTSYMTPQRVSQAIAVLGSVAVNAHATNTSNPHAVTKAQVGLGNVQNYSMATAAEAVAGVSTTTYMSPSATKAATDVIVASLSAHANSQLNPHNVNKDQIGLFNVENYPVATAQEAQAGTLNDRYMTPLRVKQAITAQAAVELSGHTSDFDNPHNVTKAQVGLINVENYAIASQLESEAGVATDKYMTPLRTAQAISAQVGQQFLTHLNATNPHSLTKADIGLQNVQNFAVATQLEAETGTATDKYMTPQRVTQAIMKLAGNDTSVHVGRTDNPHSVTAAQVGTYTSTQIDDLLAIKLDTGATASNSALLENRTATSIIEEAVSSSLIQFNTNVAPQARIPVTVNNPSYGDIVWVKLGSLYLDPVDPIEHGTLQWIIAGGGSSMTSVLRNGPQLQTILLSAEMWFNTDGTTSTIMHDVRAHYLSRSNGLTDAPFELEYTFNPVTGQMEFYAKVYNGRNQITVTDINTYEWAEIDVVEVGDVQPAGAIPLTTKYISEYDPNIAQMKQDIIALAEEVRDSLAAIQAAIASSYPEQ